MQYLFMLLKRRAAETAAGYLAAGGRSVAGFVEMLNVVSVPVADDSVFTNVNTVSDLEAVERRLGKDWRSEPE